MNVFKVLTDNMIDVVGICTWLLLIQNPLKYNPMQPLVT